MYMKTKYLSLLVLSSLLLSGCNNTIPSDKDEFLNSFSNDSFLSNNIFYDSFSYNIKYFDENNNIISSYNMDYSKSDSYLYSNLPIEGAIDFSAYLMFKSTLYGIYYIDDYMPPVFLNNDYIEYQANRLSSMTYLSLQRKAYDCYQYIVSNQNNYNINYEIENNNIFKITISGENIDSIYYLDKENQALVKYVDNLNNYEETISYNVIINKKDMLANSKTYQTTNAQDIITLSKLFEIASSSLCINKINYVGRDFNNDAHITYQFDNTSNDIYYHYLYQIDDKKIEELLVKKDNPDRYSYYYYDSFNGQYSNLSYTNNDALSFYNQKFMSIFNQLTIFSHTNRELLSREYKNLRSNVNGHVITIQADPNGANTSPIDIDIRLGYLMIQRINIYENTTRQQNISVRYNNEANFDKLVTILS